MTNELAIRILKGEVLGTSEQTHEAIKMVVTMLIRCKECKWFGDLGCAIRIVDDSDKPTENDYCSFAERKSG